MNLQEQFQAAAETYAANLRATAERERLAAVALEAQHADTTAQGAAALGAMFDELDQQQLADFGETTTDDEGETA